MGSLGSSGSVQVGQASKLALTFFGKNVEFWGVEFAGRYSQASLRHSRAPSLSMMLPRSLLGMVRSLCVAGPVQLELMDEATLLGGAGSHAYLLLSD